MSKGYAAKSVSDMEQLLTTEKDLLKVYDVIRVYPGYKERGSSVEFQRPGRLSSGISNWTFFYYRTGTEDTEENDMEKLLRNSDLLKEYRTEGSFDKMQNWWWNYNGLW